MYNFYLLRTQLHPCVTSLTCTSFSLAMNHRMEKKANPRYTLTSLRDLTDKHTFLLTATPFFWAINPRMKKMEKPCTHLPPCATSLTGTPFSWAINPRMEKIVNILYTLTSLSDLTERHTFLWSHKPQDGDDGKPSVHTSLNARPYWHARLSSEPWSLGWRRWQTLRTHLPPNVTSLTCIPFSWAINPSMEKMTNPPNTINSLCHLTDRHTFLLSHEP